MGPVPLYNSETIQIIKREIIDTLRHMVCQRCIRRIFLVYLFKENFATFNHRCGGKELGGRIMARKSNMETLSKKQIAYIKIKEMIIDGTIKKEMPLVERQLCEVLDISRTPVREALRELAADGLVEIIDGKGVFVKRIEFRDMIEIFEVREALECMAMKLFMERAEPEKVSLFQEYMRQQEAAYEAGKHEEFMKADMKIHSLIAEGAQNTRLKNSIAVIYDQIRQIAISAKDDKTVRDMAIKAHRKILDAVIAGDSEAAQKAVVEHIVEVKNMHKDRYYML